MSKARDLLARYHDEVPAASIIQYHCTQADPDPCNNLSTGTGCTNLRLARKLVRITAVANAIRLA